MIYAVGLALLGLTLYLSTLSSVLRSYSRAKLTEQLSEAGRERWLAFLDRHDLDLQALTSLLRTLTNIGVLAVAFIAFMDGVYPDFRPSLLLWPSLTAAVLLLVFSTAIPHALSLHAGEGVLARSLPLLAPLRWLMAPVTAALRGIEFVVRRLLGRPDVQAESEVTERVEQEILEAVSEGEQLGAVAEEQKEMIRSVFELGQTTVAAIMTPRTEVTAVTAGSTFDEVRETIVKTGHSRVPVYEQTIDHIVGVVYAKDLLRLRSAENFDVRKIMRTAPYVPETKTIDELLNEFRAAKVQIAIVLDEYGGTAGIATIEDILEELVGEIDDEYDQPPPPMITRVDDDTLEVDGRVHVYDINQELGISLPEDGEYETIGGFVFATLGRIPGAGEEFTQDSLVFKVMEAEPRRVKRLRLRALREAEAT